MKRGRQETHLKIYIYSKARNPFEKANGWGATTIGYTYSTRTQGTHTLTASQYHRALITPGHVNTTLAVPYFFNPL